MGLWVIVVVGKSEVVLVVCFGIEKGIGWIFMWMGWLFFVDFV